MNDKDKKIMEDIMNLDLSLGDRFNLLLVFRRKRPAFIPVMPGKKDSEGRPVRLPLDVKRKIIKDINKKIPFFVITLVPTIKPHLGDSIFISRKKLPKQKKNETIDHYRGRLLGYDVPLVDMKANANKLRFTKFVSYYLYRNDERMAHIFGERVNFFNQINPQKLKDFDQVAREIGYRVKLGKKKVDRKK